MVRPPQPKAHLLSNAVERFKANLGPPRDDPYTIKKVKSNEIYVLDMGNSKKLEKVPLDLFHLSIQSCSLDSIIFTLSSNSLRKDFTGSGVFEI